MATAAGLAGREPLRVGSVEVRPATREVLGRAGREVIEPRVMQVLVILAEAQGEVVSRDRLVSECWEGRAVSEDAINRVIQRLRRVAEATGGGFLIKTVHKVGYRLLAVDAEAAESGAPSSTSASMSRRGLIAAGVALLAGIGGAAVWRDTLQRRQVETLIEQADQALRLGMPAGDVRAEALLRQAAALDPKRAAVWGQLALARTSLAEFAPTSSSGGAVAGVQDAARRALHIDPRQPDALGALAVLPPYYGDWTAAERRMRSVLGIAPLHLPTLDALAFMLTTVGRIREGCGDRVRMAALDPFHATYQFKLIYAHWLLGDLNAADRAADRAVQLWPRHPGIWVGRYNTYALTGRAHRAVDLVDNGGARPDLPPFMIQLFRTAAVALADDSRAVRAAAADNLVQAATRNPAAAVMSINLLNGLGEIDRAFEVSNAYLLEQGSLMASVRWKKDEVGLRDQRRRNTIMLFIPSAAVMRADPRFAGLVEEVGLVEYWRAARVTPDYLLS